MSWGLLVASLVGRLGRWFFGFELFSHFPVQYVLLALPLLIYWLFRRHWLGWLTAGILVWNACLVFPWWFAERPVANQPRDFRVLHSNVLFTEPDVQRILTLVNKTEPDLFVLQEMSKKTIQQVQSLKKEYPYQTRVWSKGRCFILLGSREPFQVDSVAMRENKTIHIHTTVKGRPLSLITVHPRTPIRPTWFQWRNNQLAYVARLARQQQEPTLFVGDCNTTVWSPIYRDLIANSGLTACRRGYGVSPTWISWVHVPLLMIPIDHALINDKLRTVNFQTEYLPQSDHRAVVVDLAFKR